MAATIGIGPGISAEAPRPAQTLLTEVAEQYSAAKSYRVEVAALSNLMAPDHRLQPNWREIALVVDGARWKSELRAFDFSGLRAFDGTTLFIYRSPQNEYMAIRANQALNRDERRVRDDAERLRNKSAEELFGRFRLLSKFAADGVWLRNERLVIEKQPVECAVVRIASTPGGKQKWKETLWIDPVRKVVRKSVFEDTWASGAHAGITVTTREWRRVEMNPVLPGDYFAFSPPRKARLVRTFTLTRGPSPPFQ